jgi:hypothetical protein
VLAQALAGSSRASYKSAVNHLASFMLKHSLSLTFPVSMDTLCLWAAHSSLTLKYSTIRTYLHGVATTQVEMGHSSPLISEALVWRMLKGIKRVQGAKVLKVRLPITTSILCKLETHHDLASAHGRCLRAACWLGTCGLLRSGEFAWRNTSSVVLSRSAVTFHSNSEGELSDGARRSATYLKLRLTQSKTDPFRVGVDVIVSNPLALTSMHDYLDVRVGATTDPLFISPSAGNQHAPLTVVQLVSHTQRLLNAAQVLDAGLYLGHSFRKGGATSLHEAGEPDSLIKTMGRWRSFAFATYVSTSLHLLVRAGQQMTANRVVRRKVTFDPAAVRDWD